MIIISMGEYEGIFAINKPIGITSQRAVQIIKQWTRRKTGKKNIKVGHAGTLDPLASGVLVVAIGREYTKKLHFIVKKEKEYVAKIYLGMISVTDDAEGKKKVINKEKKPSQKELEEALHSFVGEIEQRPPAYSAVKIDGQEAYKRVRRGEKVSMEKRKVFIKNITLLSYTYPYVTLRIVCGKGTFIRSLARDIGKSLGVGAYLAQLQRTRVGDFLLCNAQSLDDFGMRIAVHARELDGERIDGTRVYMSNVLKYCGEYAPQDHFFLYHRDNFNAKIAPPARKNYHFEKIGRFPLWTQTRFALTLLRHKPDVLWMPFHNLPYIRSKKMKTVVTVHDLAFKIFPETFTKKDLRKLCFLTDHAVKKSDYIIAVSKATKRDLLRFYPDLRKEKISVVYHGIDMQFWQERVDEIKKEQTLLRYKVADNPFIIHVGAIQPRKNLSVLIDAFAIVKKKYHNAKLLCVGGDGWLWQQIKEHAAANSYASDIIFTGNIPFVDVRTLVQNARVFVFPSLYEGFGLPGLEACAAGVPVVAAHNSSLPEILGDGAIYFNTTDSHACAVQIKRLFDDKNLWHTMRTKGRERAAKFSWETTAKKTLSVLHR